MMRLRMERFVTLMALILCYTENGNVGSTQPTMII